jgi:hypothetical protein
MPPVRPLRRAFWLAALAALVACIPEPYEGTKDAPPARPT